MADQGGLWLVGRRSVCGCRLSLGPIGCTSAVCDMNSAVAAAVCGLWHYTRLSVMCLCLRHLRACLAGWTSFVVWST